MKKGGGVRLQELPLSLLLCGAGRTFPASLSLCFFSPSLISFSPSKPPLVLLLFIFSPGVCPSLLPLKSPFTVTPSLSPSPLHIFLSSFPQGLPAWYSACVAGRQDGLEHGQAPQTTLIHRTAFQSLLHCCSTYINTRAVRETHIKRGKNNGNNSGGWKQTGKGQMQNYMKSHCCHANRLKYARI